MTKNKIHVDTALLPGGWAASVVIETGDDGAILSVTADSAPQGCDHIGGIAVPGMPNLHSHAFQRAMAGLAETAGPPGSGDDSFWTWRKVMYGFVERLAPPHVAAIARQVYVEMLKAGYTAVGEFHYLHHGVDGEPYDDPAEMSERVIAAAADAGIGITHMPVLYAHGDFGGAPAQTGQHRFLNDGERFIRLVETLRARHGGGSGGDTVIGIAPHSLRAVTPELLRGVVEAFTAMDSPKMEGGPIHIHIAEQAKEVDDCLAWSGRRPVAWLLDQGMVDRRWCLVHATHMDGDETAALARSGAVAGLCPTTEANLGDGLFPAPRYLGQGGRMGIGSDSHVSVSVAEELRWLEYGQRLVHRKRNLLAGGPSQKEDQKKGQENQEDQADQAETRSTGGNLYRLALAGGAQALGRPTGAIAPGRRADLVFLDENHASLVGKTGDAILDGWLFAAQGNPVRHVMAGGRFAVRDGRHEGEEGIAAAYGETLKALMAG